MSSINLSILYHMSQLILKTSIGGNSEQSQSRHVSKPRPVNTTSLSINVSSSMSFLLSKTTNFPKEVKSSLLCLGTPYQSGDFQAIMGSSELNNNSYRNQVISLQVSSSSKTPEVKISRSRNYNG
ncbi:hypothetical protein MTR_3g463140 [Medicago truncatula]|uniref:Uncharacterized protein n=1 Tax=Medicago truncatula TaxID=3880 RepID=G7ZYH5_MEDTR|nr:hypothetical protein MTR_3g463140 [Medicago truncatula]